MTETPVLKPNDREVGGVSILMLMNTNHKPKLTPYTLMIDTPILNPNDRGVGGVSMLMLMNTNPNPKWTPYTLMIEEFP